MIIKKLKNIESPRGAILKIFFVKFLLVNAGNVHSSNMKNVRRIHVFEAVKLNNCSCTFTRMITTSDVSRGFFGDTVFSNGFPRRSPKGHNREL